MQVPRSELVGTSPRGTGTIRRHRKTQPATSGRAARDPAITPDPEKRLSKLACGNWCLSCTGVPVLDSGTGACPDCGTIRGVPVHCRVHGRNGRVVPVHNRGRMPLQHVQG